MTLLGGMRKEDCKFKANLEYIVTMSQIAVGARVVAQQLRALVALTEDLCLVPRAHMVAYNYPYSNSRGSSTLLNSYMMHMCTCRQKTHKHKIKINLKIK